MYTRNIVNDASFIPHGVLHYYTSGHTYDETLANLLRSQDKDPKLFPRVHADEVEFWYNSFKNGNYNLFQEPTPSPRTMLENLPMLDQVIHSVSAIDQQALRATCSTFKTFIDDEKRLFDAVELRMNKESVLFLVHCGTTYETNEIIYKKKENHCEIIKESDTTLSDLTFMEAALKDFSDTLKARHTKINKLVIRFSEKRVSIADDNTFLKLTGNVLNAFEEKADVGAIDLCCRTAKQFEHILGALKPGALTKLELQVFEDKTATEEDDDEADNDNEGNDEEDETGKRGFPIKKAPSLSLHWPHLKYLTILSVHVNMKLEEFTHIPFVYVHLTKVTIEEIVAYKNRILQLPYLEIHSFGVSWEFEPEDMRNAMKPFEPSVDAFEDDDVVSGSIPFPNDSDRELCFEIGRTIKFHEE